jgi:hypothetical protein
MIAEELVALRSGSHRSPSLGRAFRVQCKDDILYFMLGSYDVRRSQLPDRAFGRGRRGSRPPSPFAVEDANGVALAYVYFDDGPSRRGLVYRLSGADAKAVARMVASAEVGGV